MSTQRNIIYIPRGNTCNLTIVPSIDGETEYILQEGDIIYFSVATNPTSKRIILSKTLTLADYINDNLILTLTPEDTINLQEFCYCFDLAIKFADTEEFYTFIRPEVSDFIVTGAISHPEEDISEDIPSDEITDNTEETEGI